MVTLWLLVCLAYDLFSVWLSRNVKGVLRRGRTCRFWVRRIAAEFTAGLPVRARTRSP